MDTKVKGIVVKLIDYKDADKLASIFSFDVGNITAKFTGVKKDKAKFKAVAQPFVFAEFLVNENGKNKTVISADVIDSFNGILLNYSKTICGYVVLDIIKSLLVEEKPENDIFLLTLSSLKNIEQNNEYVALIDYILKFISFNGLGLIFLDEDYVYLDNLTGNFTKTRTNNSIQIDKKVYQNLKAINNGEIVENNPIILKQCLRFLHNVIYLKFGEDIKSFQFI